MQCKRSNAVPPCAATGYVDRQPFLKRQICYSWHSALGVVQPVPVSFASSCQQDRTSGLGLTLTPNSMSKLLGDRAAKQPTGNWVPRAWFVDGEPFTNSAAKFWLSLLDEISQDYPDCTTVELEAATCGPLDPSQLHPEQEFAREAERLWGCRLQDLIRETVAQLELLGPPGPVIIRLFSGSDLRLEQILPTECVDAEIYPYLITWLLEWSRLAALHWNNPLIEGSFTATDRDSRRIYHVQVRLENQHLSEDLFRRRLRLSVT